MPDYSQRCEIDDCDEAICYCDYCLRYLCDIHSGSYDGMVVCGDCWEKLDADKNAKAADMAPSK